MGWVILSSHYSIEIMYLPLFLAMYDSSSSVVQYSPFFPPLDCNFMLDPTLERVSDVDMTVLYLRQVFTTQPTEEIGSFVVIRNRLEVQFATHQSSLMEVINKHCYGELSIVNPSNVLYLIDNWRDLGIAFFSAFLKDQRQNSMFL